MRHQVLVPPHHCYHLSPHTVLINQVNRLKIQKKEAVENVYGL